jgi:type I restriction enzyme S subunit
MTINATPTLPATTQRPGYKHSKLGWIPVEWEVVRLGDFIDVIGGYAFKSHKFIDNGRFQVVKMANLYNGTFDLNRSQSFLSTIEENEREYILLDGDIIMSLTGTVGKDDYGNSVLLNHPDNLLLNQRVCRLRSDKSFEQPFLYYLTKSSRFRQQFFFSSRGGTGNQANVGIKDVQSIKIPLPPLPEQQRIANLLTTWDRAITTTQALIKHLEARKRGLMQRLLTGEMRLPGFEGHWKEHSYKSLLKEVKRPVEWNDDDLYELISVRRRSGGLFHRNSLLGKEIKTKDLRTARIGDFLISKMQVVHGASGLVTPEFDSMKISGSYLSLVARNPEILNIDFLNWVSKLPRFYHQTYVSSYGVHIEKMTFNFHSFLKLKLALPSVKEQIAIIQILDSADKEIKIQRTQLKQLKHQKRGLMQQLLAGQKRLLA